MSASLAPDVLKTGNRGEKKNCCCNLLNFSLSSHNFFWRQKKKKNSWRWKRKKKQQKLEKNLKRNKKFLQISFPVLLVFLLCCTFEHTLPHIHTDTRSSSLQPHHQFNSSLFSRFSPLPFYPHWLVCSKTAISAEIDWCSPMEMLTVGKGGKR